MTPQGRGSDVVQRQRRDEIAVLSIDYETDLRIAAARRRIVESQKMIERARQTRLAVDELRRRL